jgi:UDP-N-acetylglucosamine acyltransferase
VTTDIEIHPTALVESGAELDMGVKVGPYCVIGGKVKVGKNTRLHSHVVLTGRTQIGAHNIIFTGATLGHYPPDLKYKGEDSTLEIGDENSIREYATLHIGTAQGRMRTRVGNNNLIMPYVHIAHDCVVGDNNIFANASQVAGHVEISDKIFVAGAVAIHQYVRVGDLGMAAMGATVVQDIPPYCIAEGNRASLRGLNVEGMRRRGLLLEVRQALKEAYKIIFLGGYGTTEKAFDQVEEAGLLKFPEVNNLISFIKTSKRGVVRPAAY